MEEEGGGAVESGEERGEEGRTELVEGRKGFGGAGEDEVEGGLVEGREALRRLDGEDAGKTRRNESGELRQMSQRRVLSAQAGENNGTWRKLVRNGETRIFRFAGEG